MPDISSILMGKECIIESNKVTFLEDVWIQSIIDIFKINQIEHKWAYEGGLLVFYIVN